MSRYTEAHKQLNGPGDERPTALQIIKDNQLEGALKDKVVLMTGASAGIGIETARALAATGARCFLGVRNMEKGQKACSNFLEPGRVELIKLDTSSLSSIRKAAAEFLQKSDNKLNILVNNAGIMANPTQEISEDGHEMQFATNFLGHFLLYRLVEKALLDSSSPSFNSRVVNVSSSGHQASGVVFDNLRLDHGAYKPYVAYGQSKTATIYMTNHIERLYSSKGLHGLSVMPGGIMSNLQKHWSDDMKKRIAEGEDTRKFMKNEEQGAATTIYAALDKDWEGKGGEYLEDCNIAKSLGDAPGDGARGAAKHIHDEEAETKLWNVASKLVGLDSSAVL